MLVMKANLGCFFGSLAFGSTGSAGSVFPEEVRLDTSSHWTAGLESAWQQTFTEETDRHCPVNITRAKPSVMDGRHNIHIQVTFGAKWSHYETGLTSRSDYGTDHTWSWTSKCRQGSRGDRLGMVRRIWCVWGTTYVHTYHIYICTIWYIKNIYYMYIYTCSII